MTNAQRDIIRDAEAAAKKEVALLVQRIAVLLRPTLRVPQRPVCPR